MIGKALCILLDHLRDNEHTLKITGESSCILKLAYIGSNEMLQTPLTILPSLSLQFITTVKLRLKGEFVSYFYNTV